jgi:OOP family OmpA-OmpF porin
LNNWFEPNNGTTDYFKKCRGKLNSPILDYSGHSEPQDGNAFIGLVNYSSSNVLLRRYREYIAVRLTNELEKDSLYEISFYLKVASLSDFCMDYVELAFSKEKESKIGSSVIRLKSTLEKVNFDINCNSDEWELYKSSFKAKGGELFLTIGNFRKNRNTIVWERTKNISLRSKNEKLHCYIYLDTFNLVKISSEKERAKTPRKL